MTTTTFISVPDPGEPLDKGGKMNPTWYAFLKAVTKSANGALNAVNNFNVWAPFVVKFPEVETVAFGLDCNFDWEITDVVTQMEAGTVSVQLVVNGVAVGSVIGATTTKLITSVTGGDVASGQDISLTFSSPSSDAENLTIALRGIRSF